MGVYGWSYGGYMALMCLTRAPGAFKMGVAGAPVTHWDGYDTHYTERYMGTPRANPEGYAASSPMTHIANLRGSLLIAHGLIDENVHFRHAARLINALIKARKRYELLMFPDERHMPRNLADRVYMEGAHRRVLRAQFVRLGGAGVRVFFARAGARVAAIFAVPRAVGATFAICREMSRRPPNADAPEAVQDDVCLGPTNG